MRSLAGNYPVAAGHRPDGAGARPCEPASMQGIVTRGLTKTFGAVRAVDDVDLEVRPGEVFGFIGPNGAGKTTVLRLLVGLLRPTSGTASVLGHDVVRDGILVRRRLGYLPGELALQERLTARAQLHHLSRLRGGVPDTAVTALADRLDLPLDRRIGDLSKGNKQKVGLVQAFMHRPDVLLLDEPTSGLDPLLQQTFHALVTEACARGATVVLSSHVLSEVEHVAQRVGMIRGGRLLGVDDLAVLRAGAPRRVHVRFGGPVDTGTLAGLRGVRDLVVTGPTAAFTVRGDLDPVVKALAEYEVVELEVRPPDLEDLVLSRYADGAAGDA